MLRRNPVREHEGVKERRCPAKNHAGSRWLPFDLLHFFRTSRYCKVCQRDYARAYWRDRHPKVEKRASQRKPVRNTAADDLARRMSGWGRSW